MSTLQASTQSAAERKAAEAELSKLLDKHASDHQQVVAALRKWLQKRLPTAYEIVYEYENLGAVVVSFSPNEQGYAGVFGIRASADGVKLYFNQGKGLPDPEKLLQGSANARWILVEGATTVKVPAVTALVDGAIAHNKVPFARTGRGPVLIQSTAAKKSKAANPAKKSRRAK